MFFGFGASMIGLFCTITPSKYKRMRLFSRWKRDGRYRNRFRGCELKVRQPDVSERQAYPHIERDHPPRV
jgi:hypothetical protein